eukprot:6856046-Pyramimonas_sp.AAC.2
MRVQAPQDDVQTCPPVRNDVPQEGLTILGISMNFVNLEFGNQHAGNLRGGVLIVALQDGGLHGPDLRRAQPAEELATYGVDLVGRGLLDVGR